MGELRQIVSAQAVGFKAGSRCVISQRGPRHQVALRLLMKVSYSLKAGL